MPGGTTGSQPSKTQRPEGITGVIAAMPEEAAPLMALLSDVQHVHRRTPRIVTGLLQGHAVALCVTGDGARNAREGVAVFLAALPIERAIIIGVSGGLHPELTAGELFVAQRVLASANSQALAANSEWCTAAAETLGVRRASVVTSERIAESALEKRELLALTEEPEQAAAVDLESLHYAAALERAGLPWLIVRAISDTAGEAVPGLLNRCRDVGGSVRRLRVARALLGEPRTLAALLGLRARVNSAALQLAAAVSRVLCECRAPIVRGASNASRECGPERQHGVPHAANEEDFTWETT